MDSMVSLTTSLLTSGEGGRLNTLVLMASGTALAMPYKAPAGKATEPVPKVAAASAGARKGSDKRVEMLNAGNAP